MNTTDMSKLSCCNYSSNDGLAALRYHIKYFKGTEVILFIRNFPFLKACKIVVERGLSFTRARHKLPSNNL